MTKKEAALKREHLIRSLNGLYEYKEMGDFAGDDKSVARGGYVFISPRLSLIGVITDLHGQYLWTSTEDEGQQVLARRVRWEADGGFNLIDDQLTLRYAQRCVETGWKIGSIRLDSESYLPLNPGEFENLLDDGKLVRGDMVLRSMTGPDDLQWRLRELLQE